MIKFKPLDPFHPELSDIVKIEIKNEICKIFAGLNLLAYLLTTDTEQHMLNESRKEGRSDPEYVYDKPFHNIWPSINEV